MLTALLASAPLSNAFQYMVSKRPYTRFTDRYIRARPGDRILDIGCGTAKILSALKDVHYLGFDPSPDYIAAARRRYGDRAEFRVGTCDQFSLPAPHSMDLVLALGVLHHVDDAAALAILRTAQSALKPGGRFFSFDGCFVPSQSIVAKWLLRWDRGGHVRTEPAYRALAAGVFPNVKVEIRHDLMRVPYTHILMDCS